MFEENGLSWRMERRTYLASGPNGWRYGVYTDWWPRCDRMRWVAFAGRAISHTVDLGIWGSFATAAAACEEHAVRAHFDLQVHG